MHLHKKQIAYIPGVKSKVPRCFLEFVEKSEYSTGAKCKEVYSVPEKLEHNFQDSDFSLPIQNKEIVK